MGNKTILAGQDGKHTVQERNEKDKGKSQATGLMVDMVGCRLPPTASLQPRVAALGALGGGECSDWVKGT